MSLITYDNLEDGTPITANVFNERFAQIIAQINGNLDENNFKDAGISKQKLKTEVYESIYPVGSMYVNFTDDTNPATLLGFGTWTAVAGRFIAGYDGTQTDFNASEKTGGDTTHTHPLSDNGAAAIRISSSSPHIKHRRVSGIASWDSNWSITTSFSINNTSSSESTGAALRGNTDDGSSLPPYIVGYVWKRVS